MTDDEIIAPGRLTFPNGGQIDVDSIYNGQVCFRRWMPGADEPDWLRTPIAQFVMLAREQGGIRATPSHPAEGDG